ncbi:hypothetical protein [Cupriavidus sp. D39]|uniref:hypothetical protein n=1 Tax=Cupriavidus sp. D39 TaxID=2997877 RepID=UPI0022700D80|nr:hypothetical protein [Cupriavidus sp. D39]MCY0856424.1 hypothetical protein [Cupriavidus sp. D39]
MHNKSANAAITAAAALAAALLAGAAQAATPQDRALYGDRDGDRYGYNFHVGKVDPYTDGGRTAKFDSFGEGARQVDPYTDGGRTIAGMDRSGVSSDPARNFDVYTDGARA